LQVHLLALGVAAVLCSAVAAVRRSAKGSETQAPRATLNEVRAVQVRWQFDRWFAVLLAILILIFIAFVVYEAWTLTHP
jgi:uncharacterized membrane protein YukC